MNTQEEGNTLEVTISVWETDWSDYVEKSLLTLSDRFDVYRVNGEFKITVEFIPGTQDEA